LALTFFIKNNFYYSIYRVPPALDGVKWVEAIDRNVANPSVRYMELNPAKYRIVENGYKSNCDEFWKPHMT
jgi:hypothetical protein